MTIYLLGKDGQIRVMLVFVKSWASSNKCKFICRLILSTYVVIFSKCAKTEEINTDWNTKYIKLRHNKSLWKYFRQGSYLSWNYPSMENFRRAFTGHTKKRSWFVRLSYMHFFKDRLLKLSGFLPGIQFSLITF